MACVARFGKWLKLTKEPSADKEGSGPPLPRIAFENIRHVDSLSHCKLSMLCMASHGRATTPHNNECRERIRTIVERTLSKARMNAYKDRVAETERVKER